MAARHARVALRCVLVRARASSNLLIAGEQRRCVIFCARNIFRYRILTAYSILCRLKKYTAAGLASTAEQATLVRHARA